jgi:hypothetical protein
MAHLVRYRIYFLLLLNKTNGKKAKEKEENAKGKENITKEPERQAGEREEEKEHRQDTDVDVLSEHAYERYFEQLIFDYQQVLPLALFAFVLLFFSFLHSLRRSCSWPHQRTCCIGT